MSAQHAQRCLRVAVNGCGHGDLDAIYATIQSSERASGKKVDLLLCCGDFQALRNVDDLHCFHCPPKYRALKDFHKYYSGERQAPIPTVFVGGNHEAVNHLWELYYGGWAAPNIYYMGHAGVVRFGGLRIGGLSGIYNKKHYTMGHFELPPYDRSSVCSAYHVRDLEIYRLLKIKEPLDVMLTHDWPAGIAQYGDVQKLLRQKPYFREEVESNQLGSPASWQLLHRLRPRYWFAGHLHVAFAAVVPWSTDGALGDSSAQHCTRFMAIDKPLPRRKFVQIVDVPVQESGPLEIAYDPEWLSILRETHGLMNTDQRPTRFPTPFTDVPAAAASDREFVDSALRRRTSHAVPSDGFVRTVDPSKRGQGSPPTSVPSNAQTMALLDLVGKPWNLGPTGGTAGGRHELTGDDLLGTDGDAMFQPVDIHNYNPHAISDARDTPGKSNQVVGASSDARVANPEEIDIDDI